jgi:hypothetical protein
MRGFVTPAFAQLGIDRKSEGVCQLLAAGFGRRLTLRQADGNSDSPMNTDEVFRKLQSGDIEKQLEAFQDIHKLMVGAFWSKWARRLGLSI